MILVVHLLSPAVAVVAVPVLKALGITAIKVGGVYHPVTVGFLTTYPVTGFLSYLCSCFGITTLLPVGITATQATKILISFSAKASVKIAASVTTGQPMSTALLGLDLQNAIKENIK